MNQEYESFRPKNFTTDSTFDVDFEKKKIFFCSDTLTASFRRI